MDVTDRVGVGCRSVFLFVRHSFIKASHLCEEALSYKTVDTCEYKYTTYYHYLGLNLT